MRRSVGSLVLSVVVACGGAAPRTTPAPAPAKPPATAATDDAPAGDAHVAMILLGEARLPDPAAVVTAYRELAPDGPALTAEPSEDRGIVTFALGPGFVSVGLMPRAVPDGEADEHAAFSLTGLGGWRPAPHAAHLLVLHVGDRTRSRLDQVRTFTHVVAAIGAAAPPVGVYVGGAGATFEPAFFARAAREPEPIVLWSGVSVAGDDARVSLLSTGMKQFGLPEIEVRASTAGANDALAFLYDLMLYVVQRGTAIPDGDTVGGDAATRHRVTYAPSPVDPDQRVMRIDLP